MMGQVNGAGRRLRRFLVGTLVAATLTAPAVGAQQSALEGFEGLLQDAVTNGEVDYPAIATDNRFAAFIDYLGETAPESFGTPDEALAYLINAYNAFAIKGILDGSSPSSFFGRIGYFKTDTYTLGGESIDLYDLERDIIIPRGESRIHFAINCASQSCPVLQPGAWRAENLDDQLDKAARQFINDPSRNRFDKDEKVAYLSQIFEWFGDEFASHSGSVQKYVARFVDDPEVAAALREDGYRVEILEYDWSLNGIAPAS
jgi:hypothetical protein